VSCRLVFFIRSWYWSKSVWERTPCRIAINQVKSVKYCLKVMLLRYTKLACRSISIDVEA